MRQPAPVYKLYNSLVLPLVLNQDHQNLEDTVESSVTKIADMISCFPKWTDSVNLKFETVNHSFWHLFSVC